MKTKYRVRLLEPVQSIVCCVSVSQELHPSRLHQLADYIITLHDTYVPIHFIHGGQQI